jgi:hypothetical protein
LVRSAGGWGALTTRRHLGDRLHGDERILGESHFVDATLTIAGERLERRQRLRARGRNFDWLLRRVAATAGLQPADLLTPSKIPARVEHRSMLCYWAVRELGLPGTVVANHLGLTQSAISRSVARGERLVREKRDSDWKYIIS